MKKDELLVLHEIEVENIRKLVEEKRLMLGFVGDTPIANDIFTILDNMGSMLL